MRCKGAGLHAMIATQLAGDPVYSFVEGAWSIMCCHDEQHDAGSSGKHQEAPETAVARARTLKASDRHCWLY